MTAHITIIVTMLISVFHTPVCNCHSSRLKDLPSTSSGVVQCCHHSSDESGDSLPCPARPDCCCRTAIQAMLVDSLESGIAIDTRQPVRHIPVDDSSIQSLSTRWVLLAANSSPMADSGGRTVLLCTHRLLI